MREVMDNGKNSERLAAARELLDRTLGKAVQADLLERIEAMEVILAAKECSKSNNRLDGGICEGSAIRDESQAATS
jgi:hypothetical protein